MASRLTRVWALRLVKPWRVAESADWAIGTISGEGAGHEQAGEADDGGEQGAGGAVAHGRPG